jgi:hypothetical protein
MRKGRARLLANLFEAGGRLCVKAVTSLGRLRNACTTCDEVGFRRPGMEWVFLTERELSRDAVALASAGPHVEVRVIAEAGGLERLRSKLADLGFSFVATEQNLDIGMPEERIQVIFDFLVDKTILRAASKIVFNYAAKVLGADVVRRTDLTRSANSSKQAPRSEQEWRPAKDRLLSERKPIDRAFTHAVFVGRPSTGLWRE